MTRLYYGLVHQQQLVDTAAFVATLIPGGNALNTFHLLLETCAVETKLGQFKDPTPNGAGRGVPQIDADTFEWLKTKYRDSKQALLILDRTGIDIERVGLDDLDYNPLLALIWCRLRYCAVPLAIPDTQASRAAYWKLYYNTSAGKGTEQDYLQSAKLLTTLDLGSNALWDM